MIPVLYEPKYTDFTTLGLGILKDAEECIVEEQANGLYELTLVYPTKTKFDKYFEKDYQIKAKPNDIEDYHIFNIESHHRDTIANRWIVKAETRTNKLGKRTIKNADIKQRPGFDAIKIVENSMDLGTDVTLFSDITTVSSTTFEATNPLNCIAGQDGSLLQLWGGEIKKEPFKLSLLKRRGRDNVTTLRYGKDLTGLSIDFNWDNIRTRIHPYADIQNKQGEMERLWGDTVDSQYINNYPDVYTMPIQFTEEQGVTDKNSLNKVAKKYFTSLYPNSDKPSVSCQIEIDNLPSLTDNPEFEELRKIGLFDTFMLYHKGYDLYFEVKVIGIQYDSLTQRNIRLSAGDEQYKFYQTQEYDLRETLKKQSSKSFLSVFVDYVTSVISGNDGGNVIWWPKNRPSDLFFIDTDSLETAKQVLRINKSGIGFSKNGWNGPFNTAWTLDGILTLGDGMLQIGTADSV